MTRNATTGEPQLEGDYLINAQGEDVVAGTRQTLRIAQLGDDMPEQYLAVDIQRLDDTSRRLDMTAYGLAPAILLKELQNVM